MAAVPLFSGLGLKNIRSFTFVGAIGFLVDGGILQLLFTFGHVRPLWARAVSFPIAVTVTWMLNKRMTFSDRSTRNASYWIYVMGQLFGGLLNVGGFAASLWVLPRLSTYPLAATAFGSGVAMVFNYIWAAAVVFRRQTNVAQQQASQP